MRGIAIATSLLLGASTLAAAQSYDRHEWRRDQGYHDRYRAQWDTLAQGLMASSRQTINLTQPVYYSRIRIQAVRGQPAIGRVVVLYADGSRQEVMVRSRLGMSGQSSSIDIMPDRDVPVSGVRIRAATDPYSAYSIYGEARVDQDERWHGPRHGYSNY